MPLETIHQKHAVCTSGFLTAVIRGAGIKPAGGASGSTLGLGINPATGANGSRFGGGTNPTGGARGSCLGVACVEGLGVGDGMNPGGGANGLGLAAVFEPEGGFKECGFGGRKPKGGARGSALEAGGLDVALGEDGLGSSFGSSLSSFLCWLSTVSLRSAALTRERCSFVLARPIRLVSPTDMSSPSTVLPACRGRLALGTEVAVSSVFCATKFTPLLANGSDSKVLLRVFVEPLLLWSMIGERCLFGAAGGSGPLRGSFAPLTAASDV